MATTTVLSPLDGRYKKVVEPLKGDNLAISQIDQKYRPLTEGIFGSMGEKELARSRIIVEGEYLIHLSKQNLGMRRISKDEEKLIRNLYEIIDEDLEALKAIEFRGYEGIKATNHDVKAIEYSIRKKLEKTSLADVLEWTHFALTSEDTNSMAYGLMLSTAMQNVVIPKIGELVERLGHFGNLGTDTMERLNRQLAQLKDMPIMVKLNGATGNYNAHSAAFPNVDTNGWLKFTSDFVEGINEGRQAKLKPNYITTQIEPHDNYADLFNSMARVNTILSGFVMEVEKDCRPSLEIREYLHEIQKSLGSANALNLFFSSKLPISRLQRDLSDSTVERNFGIALAYGMVGYSLISNERFDAIHAYRIASSGGIEHRLVKNRPIAIVKEDKNILSYKLKNIVVPKIMELRDTIGNFAERYAQTPIAARTHGQFALPTTFGKEFHVFRARINGQLDQLNQRLEDANSFDGAAEALDSLRQINTILIDFDQDIWRYISDDWLKQKVIEGEVGSSTMPQKVNPIDFENSEGNAGLSNALLIECSTSLLLWGETDPFVSWSINEALSYSLIAYNSALKGLGKISVNEQKVSSVLDDHWEVLAEPIQIILRREGTTGAYEKLKDLTRGRKVTREIIGDFIAKLDVDEKVRQELLSLSPHSYTGKASDLVRVG